MSNRAQVSGAIGSIVDGRIRDLQEHRDLKFPVDTHPGNAPPIYFHASNSEFQIFARDIGTTAPHEAARVSAVRYITHLSCN
jgi:hypothetical protein